MEELSGKVQKASSKSKRRVMDEMPQRVQKGKDGSKRQTLCTEIADPPVMFNPISSAVPPECMFKTRLAPMAVSTTAPGTCASMVRARSMQTAEYESHTLLVSSYVPAASKILLIELSAMAAVNSPTVLADASFRCRRCSATSEAVVLMTVLTTIVPGDLGALGGPLLCAPQLPNPARMMRHVTWSRTRFDDALLRRATVDEHHECAQQLNDPMLAAPKAPTATDF
jgi:hypothetical protein